MQIYSLEKIETPRLIIRPVQLGDEIALNRSINHSLKILQPWMLWAKDPSMKATRDFVQSGVFAWASGYISDFPMVIIHKADQKIIGVSGYNDRSDPKQNSYDIGYWIDIAYQGQGLVTEYANALTRFAFLELKAKKVFICMNIHNIKSVAVAKWLNFSHEGTSINIACGEHNVFACYALNKLPPLEISWGYKSENHHDADIITWAKDTLKITNEKAFAASKAIVKTPWSNVLEINAGDEVVYLKRTPKDLFLEAMIIKLLRDRCDVKTIPEVIADNAHLHCFLMKKCGDMSLRHYFKGKLQLAPLKQGIETYKKLQKATVKQVDDLIALGVPDWRLDQFPDRYKQLISDSTFLTEHGLTKQQQDKLYHYEDTVAMLCKKLSSYKIDPCLNHSDFHDNNILYDTISKTTAIIDLGETAINHPFFSLTACLGAIKNRYHLKEDDQDYKILQKCAFSGWLSDSKKLSQVIEIINLLHPLYLLLTQKRFLDAIELPYDIEDPISVKQHNKIKKGFLWFIDNMVTI